MKFEQLEIFGNIREPQKPEQVFIRENITEDLPLFDGSLATEQLTIFCA